MLQPSQCTTRADSEPFRTVSAEATATAELRVPAGWTNVALLHPLLVGANQQGELRFRVSVPDDVPVGEQHVIVAAITLDNRRFGPVAEGIVQVNLAG